jgi:hypothetical protein
VFKNRVAEREEVTGDWRKLHSEELYDVYCSVDLIRVIKSMTLRHAVNMVRR